MRCNGLRRRESSDLFIMSCPCYDDNDDNDADGSDARLPDPESETEVSDDDTGIIQANTR